MSSVSGSRDAGPVFSEELEGKEVIVGVGRAPQQQEKPLGLEVQIEVCQG